MTDEDKNLSELKETPKEVSIVDEARAIRDEIVKAKEDLQKENDRRTKLNAEELLSSSAGGRVEPAPAKEETPHEYRMRIEKEMAEGKTDFSNDGN